MKIYAAGSPGAPEQTEEHYDAYKRLISYADVLEISRTNRWIREKLERRMITEKTKNRFDSGPVELFLDSGAFSAMTKKVHIDLDEYIEFIKKHEKYISVYANLDVIDDPDATWKNQKKMEAAGLHPLPTFHYGEDEKWLLRYLDRYEYIALGGMVPISTRELSVWLDHLFATRICGRDGMPKVKVHGFGMTSLKLMLRFPWYSVDSTSWVMTGRMGGIYMPHWRNGEWEYSEDSIKVDLSSRSPTRKESGAHISTLPPLHQKLVLRYIKEKGYHLGKSDYKQVPEGYELAENENWIGGDDSGEVEVVVENGVANNYRLRDELNIIYFLDLEKHIPKWPWAFKLARTEGFGI